MSSSVSPIYEQSGSKMKEFLKGAGVENVDMLAKEQLIILVKQVLRSMETNNKRNIPPSGGNVLPTPHLTDCQKFLTTYLESRVLGHSPESF